MAEGEAAGPNGPDEGELQGQLAEIEEIIAATAAGLVPAQPLEALPPEREIDLHEKAQDVELKGTYGRRLLSLMVLQLLVADGVFVAYAWGGKSWEVPTAAIQGWLAATLVEVIGVVLVVTRYLFPRRDLGAGDS